MEDVVLYLNIRSNFRYSLNINTGCRGKGNFCAVIVISTITSEINVEYTFVYIN